MTLEDVVHDPTAGANVVSAYQLTRAGYQVTMSPFPGGSEIRNFRTNSPPIKLVLVDQTFVLPGTTLFTSSIPPSIFLHFVWPAQERRKWLEHQAAQNRKCSDGAMDFIQADLPYMAS